MAVVAFAAEAPAMGVVGGVAADTGLRHLVFETHRLPMACATFEILMSTVENEIRTLTVVETPDPPSIRVVTLIAFIAERSLVLVVRLMA